MGDPRPAGDDEPLDFDDVYRAHAQTVARWVQRLAGPRSVVDLEDAVQEVFLIVHRELPKFRAEAKVTTWLYRIAENVVRHRRRKERFRRWLGGSADEVAGDRPSGAEGAADVMERREATRALYRALDGMSEKLRTVIILFEIEELPGDEVAELMNAKVGTVWVWLHRARAQLSARLEAEREREAS